MAAAEAANNAVCGGANMIPCSPWGVPGDTGAPLISAFLVQGLTPGPLIFTESPRPCTTSMPASSSATSSSWESPLLIYRAFTKICSMETTIIFPYVLAFCVIGVYALNSNLDDCGSCSSSASSATSLQVQVPPMATLLIGFILSPSLRRISAGPLSSTAATGAFFFSSPLCWLFWAATILSVFFIVRGKRRTRTCRMACK